jgi:hypothetical protein
MNEKASTDEEIKTELEPISESNVLQRLQQPNTQFIKRAYQLNRHAVQLTRTYSHLNDDLEIHDIKSISLRTGTGFIINTDNIGTSEDTPDELVEVIDYDPVRNNMMVIGNEPPVLDAIVHWFIYRGFQNINHILILNEPKIIEKYRQKEHVEFVYEDNLISVDLAMRILKQVKESKIVILSGSVVSGLILCGDTLDEVLKKIND